MFFNMLRDKNNAICSSEVLLRRAISSLYLALFNYWAKLCYKTGKRGKGPLKDKFSYSDFHKNLLMVGLGVELAYLYSLRVVADHYACKSTKIMVWDKIMREILGEEVGVTIDCNAFRRALETATHILEAISSNRERVCA